MASSDQIDAAIESLAAASREEIADAVHRRERAGDSEIQARVEAAISYMTEPDQRPFWGTVIGGYRPTLDGSR